MYTKEIKEKAQNIFNSEDIKKLQILTNLKLSRKYLLYCIANDILSPSCKICGKFVNSWNATKMLFRECCSNTCANKDPDRVKKIKMTNILKYGHSNILASKHGKEKIKQTNLKRYGVKNPSQNKQIREKQKQTMLDNYGVEYPGQSKEIQEKIEQTNLERYGVKNPSQNKQIREKQKQTMLDNYGVDNIFKTLDFIKERRKAVIGVEHALQSEEIREIFKQTMLQKYGVEHAHQSDNIRKKFKQTMLDRYGVEHALQSEELKEKIKQTNLDRYGTKNHVQKHMVDILPLLEDFGWMYEQYIVQQKTASQIANELSVNGTTICNYLKKYEIIIRYIHVFSNKSILWLESIIKEQNILIRHAQNGGEYKIPNTRYSADGYCKETNTIYEFHGDIWHGNPEIYESHEICNPFSDLTAGELYQKTLERENKIRELGYNLIVMWENDF
ncbi:MAG: DUF7487 domain-containing protein [Nitrosopumilaceae archaeon]